MSIGRISTHHGNISKLGEMIVLVNQLKVYCKDEMGGLASN